jgi:hypothetical protein
LFINKPLSIVGPGAPVLAISGNTNSRVFHIGPQGDVEIHGLTITEGRVVAANGTGAFDWTRATPGGDALGGGVFNEGTLKIFDSMIVSNSLQGGRGGSGSHNIPGEPLNGADGGRAAGAGIYSAGLLDLHRCTLIGNRAVGGTGGMGGFALSLSFPVEPGWGGVASGAGVFAIPASLESCTVAANLATGGEGGRGTHYYPYSPTSYGPGRPGATAAGGGLSGELTLNNCSVSGNSVTGGMGGTGSVAGVIGETYGGGVESLLLSVQSTIVAGNTGSASSPDVRGAVESQGWNLIGITDGSSGWTTEDFLGHSSFPLEAHLSPCQDNSGPVWTMRPLANSPALDAGRSGLATDARGSRRVVDFPNVPNALGGDGSDIGAFELQATTLLLTGPVKSGNDLVVRFSSDLGQRYRIERKDTLAPGAWTTVADNLSGTGGIIPVTDLGAASQPQRFYRGQVLP